MRSDVIVAYDLDGSQLNEDLRLVVPEENGNIWISGITTIKMSIFSVDQVQPGTSGQSIINQYQAIVNTTIPAPLQLPPKNETQPIIPSNETAKSPVTSPTIITIPQSEEKITEQMDSISQSESVIVIIGSVILVVFLGFVFYSRKKPNH